MNEFVLTRQPYHCCTMQRVDKHGLKLDATFCFTYRAKNNSIHGNFGRIHQGQMKDPTRG